MLARKEPDFLPRRINQYVPGMRFAAECDSGIMQVNFGTPAVADTDFIVTTVALTSGAAETHTIAQDDLGASGSGVKYGRNVTITSDAANTRTVTVKGRDYLGQLMTETIDYAGAATVAGVKAFQYIDSVVSDAEANTPNVTIGFGDVLGLPYRAIKDLSEESDGAEATIGTLVAGSRTTQTATTADPRGTYDPNTTLDATAEITATFLIDNHVDSSGVGGLHGVPHYYA
jgi:hypothetical protein